MTVVAANVYGTSDYIAPQFGAGPNVVQSLYKVVNITTAFANSNTVDIGYLPQGAVPIGGYFACEDLDTGTETLDIDVGITDNGTDGAHSAFFVDGGVLTGDNAITDFVFTNASNVRMITGPFSVTQLSAKTLVQLTCVAAANATGTGKIVVKIDYITPGKSTS